MTSPPRRSRSKNPTPDSAELPAGEDAAAPAAGHEQRLQKVLAAAGIGSRRKCEELIQSGRVEVDRQVVTHLGAKADPARQEIRLDGVLLPRPKRVHYLVHKPVGVVSTNYDQAGRPRVVDLVPKRDERLFAVGRLDMSSEGLILVTNDGDLANRLTHPRYGVAKTYQVEVAGAIERADLDALCKGVHLAEGFAHVESARILTRFQKSTLLEIVLKEGRNREIRRLLARSGHKVLRLKRVALGPLRLGELPSGDWRPIESGELRALRQAAAGRAPRPRRARARKAAPARKRAKPAETRLPTIIGGDPESKPPAKRGQGKPAERGAKLLRARHGKPKHKPKRRP